MQSNPIPSPDFGPRQRLALALAGTIAVPSPYPAMGRVFIGINPHHDPNLPGGLPRFFLKVVQAVSPKQVITRIFDLGALRAVSVPCVVEPEGASEPQPPEPVEEFGEQIAFAKKWLEDAAREPGVFELSLFPRAVLYVPESTPMLVRVQYEYGVVAAECAENIRVVEANGHQCCHDDVSAASPAPWDVVAVGE